MLQLWRKGLVRDAFVCDIPFNVPGVGIGAAHKDPFPVQYNWSSLDRFTPPWPLPGEEAPGGRALLPPDAAALLPGRLTRRCRACCGAPGPDETQAAIFRDPNLFGSGSLWIRCAWIADDEDPSMMVSAAAPGGCGTSARRALLWRQMDGHCGGRGRPHRAVPAPAPAVSLSDSGSAGCCPAQGYTNPLAAGEWEEQEAPAIMPVPPFARNHLALRGGGHGVGQVSKARLAEWLGRAGLDPNDPRNAWWEPPATAPVGRRLSTVRNAAISHTSAGPLHLNPHTIWRAVAPSAPLPSPFHALPWGVARLTEAISTAVAR